jgi:hypothetical protein
MFNVFVSLDLVKCAHQLVPDIFTCHRGLTRLTQRLLLLVPEKSYGLFEFRERFYPLEIVFVAEYIQFLEAVFVAFLLALIVLLEKRLQEPIRLDLPMTQRILLTMIEGIQVPSTIVVFTGGAGSLFVRFSLDRTTGR